jgi:hypothetical protein
MTVSNVSGVHTSDMVIPPGSASRASIEVAAKGTSIKLHPSIVIGVWEKEPVTSGL